MNKQIKFPSAMVSGDYTATSLILDGGSVIDQCIVTAGEKGTFFLEQHLLYVVLGGSVKLSHGRQSWTVNKNFLTSQDVHTTAASSEQGVRVSKMSDRLVAYCWALSPYFDNPSQINPGLLRLKVMELLYNVMDCSTSIFQQMLQLRKRNGFAKNGSQRLVKCSNLHTRKWQTLHIASVLKTQRISAVSSNNGLECRRQKYE